MDVGYHVALELTPEQVKGLKVLAATTSTSVKALVTGLVVSVLNKQDNQKK